jgi:hypothetical protein
MKLIMQEKKDKIRNRRNYVQLYGIYHVVEKKMRSEIKERGFGDTSFQKFTKIVGMYFTKVFMRCIYENDSVPLYNGFGKIDAVKSLCTKYNPKKIKYATDEDGNLFTYEAKYDVEKTEGYFYFLHWKLPRKYSWYKFLSAPKWKRMVYRNAKAGNDYLDVSMLK